MREATLGSTRDALPPNLTPHHAHRLDLGHADAAAEVRAVVAVSTKNADDVSLLALSDSDD